MRSPWPSMLLLFVVACGLPATAARPQSVGEVPGYSENQVKAAFITHLFSFIQWQGQAVPEVICTTQSSGLTDTLTALLSAKPSLGLRIVELDNLERPLPESCDAFIAQDLSDRSLALHVDSQLPMLTISDQTGFARAGGMIELERRPSRIGLIINRQRAQQAGFRISSKLLRLANIVETGAPDDVES